MVLLTYDNVPLRGHQAAKALQLHEECCDLTEQEFASCRRGSVPTIWSFRLTAILAAVYLIVLSRHI